MFLARHFALRDDRLRARRRPSRARRASIPGLLVGLAAGAAGCAADPAVGPRGEGAPGGQPFQILGLVKTDIDAALELFIREERALLLELARKLYLRNPRELAKAPGMTLERRLHDIFERGYTPADLEGLSGVDALRRALDPAYAGDRVLAFVVGLREMIAESFDGQERLYLLDRLDPQKLYHCARNLEVAVWKIENDRDFEGRRLLLTNSTAGEEPRNLSYERLFGKLIALQDMAALIVADRTNRVIRYAVQSMVFLPL